MNLIEIEEDLVIAMAQPFSISSSNIQVGIVYRCIDFAICFYVLLLLVSLLYYLENGIVCFALI